MQGGTPDAYLQSGQIVTANDPMPGRWRARLTSAGGTGLVRVASESPEQEELAADVEPRQQEGRVR